MQSPVTFSTSFLLLLIERDLCSTPLCHCRSFIASLTCEPAEISFNLCTCCFSIFIPNLFVLQIYASPLVSIFLKHLPVALGTPAWYNLHPHIFLLWNYCIDLNWYSNLFSWHRNNLPFIHLNSYSAFHQYGWLMEHNVAYIGMYSLVHEAIHIFYYTGIGANVEYFLLSCMHQPIQPKSLS